MRKSVDELKKFYEEKEKALKAEKSAAIKQAAAVASKKEAADKARLRKQDNHVKILIGGYVLSEIKRSKDTAILDKVSASIKTARDKDLIKILKAEIGKI